MEGDDDTFGEEGGRAGGSVVFTARARVFVALGWFTAPSQVDWVADTPERRREGADGWAPPPAAVLILRRKVEFAPLSGLLGTAHCQGVSDCRQWRGGRLLKSKMKRRRQRFYDSNVFFSHFIHLFHSHKSLSPSFVNESSPSILHSSPVCPSAIIQQHANIFSEMEILP